ncbi:hypothetical protein HYU92_06610 [Candidatus Curtissbacteria bacterium]|nr:hypothetical protein [Candidatus Curtissbacteria bacterium]
MPERDQPNFRSGEISRRPYGENVSLEPLPQALRALMVSRGFETQISLGKALGGKSNSTVRPWLIGRRVPSPEEFGRLLILLKPNGQELDRLVEPWRNLLQAGRGRIGGVAADSEVAIKRGKSLIKPAETPIGRWLEDYCRQKQISLAILLRILGLNINPYGQNRDNLSIDSLATLLEKSERLDLTDEEKEQLADAIAATIEIKSSSGHRFQGGPKGGKIRSMQKTLPYVTYNGVEAAGHLGVSRAAVSVVRGQLDLPLLMTAAQLAMLEGHFAKTKEAREKQKQTR